MIKIVPKHGMPYYLVPRDDTRGFGDLEQADMLIPQLEASSSFREAVAAITSLNEPDLEESAREI